MNEIQLQTQFYQHIHNTYPQIRGLIFAVPNGGYRNKIEAMQFKASGTVSGIPDMILLWKGKTYGFEVKTEKGVLSANQIKIHQIWADNGVPVYIIRTLAQWTEIIEKIIL